MQKMFTRNYHMTDSELCMYTTRLVLYMTRDAAEFLLRRVDAAAVTAMEALGNGFEVFPNDTHYRAEVMVAAEAKNGLRDELEDMIRQVVGSARIAWGARSPPMKRFDVGNMTNDSNKEFLTTSRLVVAAATQRLAELTPFGLTQAMIDVLITKNQDYEDKTGEIAYNEAIRDFKSNERINRGNELYGYVAKYCEIGKIIWADVEEAYYNDYIIYANEPNLPGKITGLNYNLVNGALFWDADPIAVVYEVAFAPDMPEPIFINIYIGPATSYTYDPGGPDNYLFRVRGINNKNEKGPWSGVLVVERP